MKTLTLYAFKGLSALGVAYVLALIGDELIGYGIFSFVFVMVFVGSAFFYFLKSYNFLGVFIVDVILIAIGLLLKLYITIAYGG